MSSCQLSTISYSLFSTLLTAGIVGLAIVLAVLIVRAFTGRGGGLETQLG